MKKHISYIILAGAILLFLSFSVSAQSLPTVTMDKPVKDMTISELQAKIAEILSVIQQMQALIAQLQPGGVGVSCNFYRNLYPGTSGSDVKCLQQYLNNAGHTLANSGPGSSGNETIYYGSLTRAAVKKWQDANNIEQGVWWGYFGPKSQAKYNELAAISGEQEEPPTPPLSGTYCGDNIAQRPSDQGIIEDCDGTDIRNKTCITQGYTGGTLLCSNDCSFNTSQCLGTGPDIPTPPTPPGPTTQCGDSIMQKPNSEGIYEVCDSTNLGTSTCSTYGYVGGTLSCSSNCITFNTSNCITASVGGGGGGGQTPVGPTCGDNTDNICPNGGCTHLQDDDCTYCGDNILQRPNNEGILEVCDTNKLNNQTCITKGFPSGTLLCSNTCLTFDTSSCTLPEPSNEAPVLGLIGNKSINENQQLSFTVSATDTDGDVLTYSVQDRPSGAIFSSQIFTWIPTYEQSGTYSLTFTVSDGSLTDTETITITVSNVNRSPVLNPIGDKTVQQDNTLFFTISGTDPDDDVLTYTASGLPSGASFNTSTRTFAWIPSNTGTYNTTFTVSDGSLTDTETITITVTSAPQPNNAPVANNQAISLDEDNLINITLSATDLDGDDLTYAIVSNPSQGALSGTAPDIIYTPNTNYNGSDSFTFRANDGQDNSNTATISLSINPINDAPVLNSIGNKSVDENSLLTFTILGTDIDGDTLYYSIQDSPSGASFNSSTRTFTWTPSYEQSGTYTPTFTVSDIQLTDQETITITVNNVVTGPVCGDSICEGTETCSTCQADCGACAPTFPTDYISYWKFDGDATDSGPGGNDGTFVGDAHIVSDAEREQVLSLDGVGDYVSFGKSSGDFGISNSLSYSLSSWVKFDDLSATYSPILSNKLAANLYFGGNSNDKLAFRHDDEWLIGTTTMTTETWYHVAVTYDGTSHYGILYLNGVQDGEGTVDDGFQNGTDLIYIGWEDRYGFFLDGLIDDVMIFNRTLTQTEIQQIRDIEVECQIDGDCNDNNDCTINTCVGVGGAGADSIGCAISFVNAGTSCDDGLFCTTAGTSTCNGAGSCTGGTALDCSDGVFCTDDSCNEALDACENAANDSNCPGEICDALLDCVADPCFGIDNCSYYDGNETACDTGACISWPGCEWNLGVCEEAEAPITDYEGFGAVTRGALDCPTGYTTYHVNDLGDKASPPYVEGQLRHAVRQNCRYIVFDVGGTINLIGNLAIKKSYITIDGSSAPSPGITLAGQVSTQIVPNVGATAHDIIIHNLRVDAQHLTHTNDDDIWAMDGGDGSIYNIIIDHVTAMRSGDGIFDMTHDVKNVTISWNLMMDTESTTLMRYGGLEGISIHHNVWARNQERQPWVREDAQLIDVVNNVVYGWNAEGLNIHHDAGIVNPSLNVENNVYHFVSGNPDNAIKFGRGPDEGDVYFNGNIVPVGEISAVSNSGRLPIPAYAEVTKYDASTLGDTVVPYVGTHYPTPEEQAFLDEISVAIGGASPARISQTDEKLNNLASVLSSIQSAVQDILKRIQELF